MIEKEQIEKMIEDGFSERKISDYLSVSHSTVRYWLNKYGLRSKYKNFCHNKSWSNEDMIASIYISKSISEVLKNMNMSVSSGNYHTVKYFIKSNKIDISHFVKTKENIISANSKRKRPLSEVMIENSDYKRTNLKKRLLKEGLIENKCQICGQLPEWNGKPMVLILDHINGVWNDHRRENLRLVCPNCNSQLSTHCGKNI